MIRQVAIQLTAVLMAATLTAAAGRKEGQKKLPESPLDRYVEEALGREPEGPAGSSGSLWAPSSDLTDLARDLRARHVDDVVTILVAERAFAVSRGATKTSRESSARGSVTSFGGTLRAASPLTNLIQAGSEVNLDGQGATSRETVLTTTVAARVSAVLPNGLLVLDGTKDIQVNSERQSVRIRGVVRPTDLTPGNVVRSDRLAHLEVTINGKGVVGDAIRRPFFLYRLLLGLLPF